MSSGMNVTNLGQMATANMVQAFSQVVAPSFSQPDQVLGSLSAPVSTLTQTYTAGINKYIFYYPAPATGVAINLVFDVINLPTNSLASNSVNVSASWILTGSTTTITTVPSLTVSSIGSTNVNGNSVYIFGSIISTTAPSFTAGTPVLKVVFTITQD